MCLCKTSRKIVCDLPRCYHYGDYKHIDNDQQMWFEEWKVPQSLIDINYYKIFPKLCKLGCKIAMPIKQFVGTVEIIGTGGGG